MKQFFIFAIAVLACTSVCSGRVVTLTVQNYNGVDEPMKEMTIEDVELAEVLTLRCNTPIAATLSVFKDGKAIDISASSGTAALPFQPIFVAGPAKIRLRADQSQAAGFCTIRVTPEAFPPDRSVLVAPGAGGAVIALECSTNLVNWTAATNGVYTNLPVAKFFRIRADRISSPIDK